MNRNQPGGITGRLAHVLVNYSTKVRPGDLVVIQCDPVALPMVEALTEAVLEAGGHPHWHARSDAVEEIIAERGNADQLSFISPLDAHMMETADVRISLWAETNTRALAGIDASRQAARVQSRKPSMDTLIRRMIEGELRWVGALYPTPAAAQDAHMSLRQFQDLVYRSGKLFSADPIAEWTRARDEQQRLCDFLQTKKSIRYFVPPHTDSAGREHDGVDLTIDTDGGTWINCAGENNFPDGEVFVGPQGAEGHVNYTYPAIHDGRAVEGVRLEFKDGRVVDATATRDEAFLHAMLDQDDGARNIAEAAIGTNRDLTRFTGHTLLDEKIGGTFHVAVGAGYPDAGNHSVSALHWDMVCDLRPDDTTGRPGGVIEADGEVFWKEGLFVDS